MTRRILCAGLAATILLSGCASITSPMTEPVRQMPSVADERVFFGSCIRETPDLNQSGVGAAIATAFIGNFVDKVGSALAEAGKDKTVTKTAHANLEVDAFVKPKCIQYIQADFETGRSFSTDLSVSTKLPSDEASFAKLEPLLTSSGIHNPRFVFEGVLISSSSGSAVTLRPSFYAYRQTLDSGRRKGERALALTFSAHNPGKPASDKSAAATSFIFGKVSPSESLMTYHLGGKISDPSPYDTPWFPNFAPPAPKTNAQPQSDGPESTSDAVKSPKTFTVSLSETRAGDKFMKFLGEIFSATSGDIKTALQGEFIPSVSDANEITATTEVTKALTAFYTAYAAAETALAEACALDPAATSAQKRAAATKVFAAQSAANVASLQTDIAAPYLDIINASGDTLPAVCGTL